MATKKTEVVKVYTTPTCPWCQKTKEYLKELKVEYKEINVAADEKARNEVFEKSGQMGVPVLDIKGKIIVGYDKEEIKKALEA
tara:strand:+ start:1497 stop:1745 length:249 start_codon:yes stop_codon:yes gene_type:complete